MQRAQTSRNYMMPTSAPCRGPSQRARLSNTVFHQLGRKHHKLASPLAVGPVVRRLSWLCKTEKPALKHKSEAGTLTMEVKSVVVSHACCHLPTDSDAGKRVNSGRVTWHMQMHDMARAPAEEAVERSCRPC